MEAPVEPEPVKGVLLIWFSSQVHPQQCFRTWHHACLCLAWCCGSHVLVFRLGLQLALLQGPGCLNLDHMHARLVLQLLYCLPCLCWAFVICGFSVFTVYWHEGETVLVS